MAGMGFDVSVKSWPRFVIFETYPVKLKVGRGEEAGRYCLSVKLSDVANLKDIPETPTQVEPSCKLCPRGEMTSLHWQAKVAQVLSIFPGEAATAKVWSDVWLFCLRDLLPLVPLALVRKIWAPLPAGGVPGKVAVEKAAGNRRDTEKWRKHRKSKTLKVS